MSEKINKANAVIGLIRRSFSFLDCRLFTKLYTTFVRPHLEYSHSVWSPHLLKHINIIENVQKRATKLVDSLHNYSYNERSISISIPTIKSLSSFRPRNLTSRNTLQPKDGTRGGGGGGQSNSFYYRIANTWNNLPKYVVAAPSINIFKNKLDDHWKELLIKSNHKPPKSDS